MAPNRPAITTILLDNRDLEAVFSLAHIAAAIHPDVTWDNDWALSGPGVHALTTKGRLDRAALAIVGGGNRVLHAHELLMQPPTKTDTPEIAAGKRALTARPFTFLATTIGTPLLLDRPALSRTVRLGLLHADRVLLKPPAAQRLAPIRVNVMQPVHAYFVELAYAFNGGRGDKQTFHLERATRLARVMDADTIASTIDNIVALDGTKRSVRHAYGIRSGDGKTLARLHERYTETVARPQHQHAGETFGR